MNFGFTTKRIILANGINILERLTCHGQFPPSEIKVRPRLKGGLMKRMRFTEELIIAVLREHEAGQKRATWRASMGSARRLALHTC